MVFGTRDKSLHTHTHTDRVCFARARAYTHISRKTPPRRDCFKLKRPSAGTPRVASRFPVYPAGTTLRDGAVPAAE